MRYPFIKQIAGLGLVVAALACPSPSRANGTVYSGWDLLISSADTTFMDMHWQGVPYGTFDFGSGSTNTLLTDTIVHRLITVSSSDPHPQFTGSQFVMEGWQLQCVEDPTLFLTLQSTHGGPASTAELDIDFTNHTFSSSLTNYWDLRYGGVDGSIINNGSCILTTSGNIWSNAPGPSYDPGAIPEIGGVNYLLNGTDITEDFWPMDWVTYAMPNGWEHTVGVPEPGSVSLLCAGGLLALWQMRRKLLRR
jgi:hypothetical protein